ncbi:MAG: C40 family peptidase, partial [Candidatus Methylacidiphilales bacterium]
MNALHRHFAPPSARFCSAFFICAMLGVALLTQSGWRQGGGVPSTYSTKSEGGGTGSSAGNYRVSLPWKGAANYSVLYEADRLTKKNLRYSWGSANPAHGGLDCSGFVIAVYKEVYGITLPDESNKQWEWLKTRGKTWDATSGWNASMLQPGDLVFYSGTINNGRAHPVTHVMIWCGGNVVAGAQYSGPRIDGNSTGGVAYFPLRPVEPRGDPAKPLAWYRGVGRVYGYARFSPNMTERASERKYLAGLSAEEAANATQTAALEKAKSKDKDKDGAASTGRATVPGASAPGTGASTMLQQTAQVSQISRTAQQARWRSSRYRRNAAAAT